MAGKSQPLVERERGREGADRSDAKYYPDSHNNYYCGCMVRITLLPLKRDFG